MKIKMDSINIIIVLLFLLPLTSGIVRNAIFAFIFVLSLYKLASKKNGSIFKIRESKYRIDGRIIRFGTLILAYATFTMIINGIETDAIERLFQIYIAIILLLCTSKQQWTFQDYKNIIWLIRVLLIICLVAWPFSGFKMNYFAGIFSRGNSFGGALICYVGLYFLVPRKFTLVDKLFSILILFFLYTSNSRSAIIALIVMFIARVIINIFHKKHLQYKNLFIIFITIALVFPFLYMLMYQNVGIRSTLNELSWRFLRKRFFSGRQTLWGFLIDIVMQSPFIGHGLNVTPESIMGGVWSAHNWYLQVLIQMGVIGLSLMVGILYSIWNTLYALRDNEISRNTAAFVLAISVWQLFEVAITQNNFSIGVMVWFVFGIGLALCEIR